jgi:hypothetical protein
MKTMIKTIAQYIANLVKVAWYELPAKRTVKVAKMVIKAIGGALWEVTSTVKDGAVVKNTVAIQGLLFNF